MSRTTRTLAIAGAAIAVAISGFLLLRPSDDEKSTSSTATSVTTPAVTSDATTATPVPEPKTTVIRLKDGAPVGGKQKIEVSKGDVIRLKVISDQAGEIHVHGFDIEKEAAPGKPATFKFTADIEGRFEVESHVSDTQIAEITVNP